MKLDYNSREIFFGNEALIVADIANGSNGKPEFTNHKIVTGLVSVGEMEDQAEAIQLMTYQTMELKKALPYFKEKWYLFKQTKRSKKIS
jgi:hypothetical protein